MMIIFANRASTLLYRFIKTFPTGTYLLPANVCPIVPLTFVKAGVSFEFVDIDSDTLCLDEKTVLSFVCGNKKYTGIIFVRTYGYQYDASGFFSKLKSVNRSFKIIDDKCLCFPDFNPIASNVDLELFSTGYAKPVEIGFGGYAKIQEGIELESVNDRFDENALSQLEMKYKEGLKNRHLMEDHSKEWLNTGNPELTLEEYLEKIEKELPIVKTHKQMLNSIYEANLPEQIVLSKEFQNWRYNILTTNKKTILNSIFSAGLFASSHYIPSSCLFEKKHYKISSELSGKVINLFNDFYFSEKQAIQLCEIVRKNL